MRIKYVHVSICLYIVMSFQSSFLFSYSKVCGHYWLGKGIGDIRGPNSKVITAEKVLGNIYGLNNFD